MRANGSEATGVRAVDERLVGARCLTVTWKVAGKESVGRALDHGPAGSARASSCSAERVVTGVCAHCRAHLCAVG